MNKRICFFTTHFDFPRQRHLDYYEKILPRDIEGFLFCKKGEETLFKIERINKEHYTCSKFFVPFELRRFCRKNGIDVITNLSGSAEVALNLVFATVFTNTKVIFRFNGNPRFNRKDFVFYFIQFFISRFLVSSKDTTERIKKNLFLSKKKIFYLPSTINTSLYKPQNKQKARKRLNKFNINKKDKIIIFVGRISYLKGSDLMLELIKRNPDKKFILIGKIMNKNFKNLNLDNLILIPSANAKELVTFYNAADLCIFLSRREGFGFVPREAMACSIPVLVSEIESLKMIKPAIKVPLNVSKADKALKSFFNLTRKQKECLSKESRNFILEECSEQNVDLKKKYLNYLLNI